MASSKRKKEKQKDFQKAKLKVGKAKAKADNFTDTSFKAKALVLGKQSIATPRDSHGDGEARFHHHISLLRHRSDSQRQESLGFLTTAVTSRPSSAPLPEPVTTLLPKLQPLLLDGSPAVRTQTLKLLKALPPTQIPGHAQQLILYVRAGMTHLSADIRLFSMDVLEWLVGAAPDETVSGAGAWVKTLRCFAGLLGWPQQESTPINGWSAAAKSVGSRPGSQMKALARYTVTLAAFIRAGLVPVDSKEEVQHPEGMPLYWMPQLGLPQRSGAFAHLNLYGAPLRDDNEILEDREDRQRVFSSLFEAAAHRSIKDMKREGGELGRASAALQRAVDDGMQDYERDD